jgi:hypothetical protein
LFGLTAPDLQCPQLRALLAILAGVVAYACAWFVALADSLLYSLFGPRNTR